MTTEKWNCEFRQEDNVGIVEESEFPIELALFPGCPGEDNMPKTSFPASARKKVPVELVLFDLSPTNNKEETDDHHHADLEVERNAAAAAAANPARIEGEMVIKKRLTKSDIDDNCRLLLANDCVRKHVLPFFAGHVVEKVKKGGFIAVRVRDLDTATEYELRFKRWLTSKSYVLINGWRSHFLARRNLKVGDEIGLCWNLENSMFHFSVLNRAPPAN